MYLQWIIAICILCHVVNCSIRNCCEGENILLAKNCTQGSLNEVLDCKSRFLLTEEDLSLIDEIDGEIVFGDVTIQNDDYCRTTINDSEVFLVCHDEFDEFVPSNVFVYFGFVSSFFLILTAGIYILIPKLLDLQGLCVVHSILGLSCAFIVMGANRLSGELGNFMCNFFAYSLYVCFLYAFFWLNTYSFHLWRTTRQPRILANVNHWKAIYHIYSCGCPLLLLLLVIFFQVSNFYIYTHPKMAEEAICWFGTLEASFVYMYVPISILLSLNILFFFMTIYTLWKEIQQYDGKRIKIIRYRLSLCLKMFLVMGISWIFEVLSAAFEHKYPSMLWKITDTINSLQGLLVFLVMVVFRKRVYRLMAEKSFCRCLPSTWRSVGDDEEEEGSTDDNDLKLDSVLDQ